MSPHPTLDGLRAPDEAVRRHLRECPRCRLDARMLEETASLEGLDEARVAMARVRSDASHSLSPDAVPSGRRRRRSTPARAWRPGRRVRGARTGRDRRHGGGLPRGATWPDLRAQGAHHRRHHGARAPAARSPHHVGAAPPQRRGPRGGGRHRSWSRPRARVRGRPLPTRAAGPSSTVDGPGRRARDRHPRRSRRLPRSRPRAPRPSSPPTSSSNPSTAGWWQRWWTSAW